MFIESRDVVIRKIKEIDFQPIEGIEEENGADDQMIVEELRPMFTECSSVVEYTGYVAEYAGEVVGYLIAFKVKAVPYLTAVVRCVVVEDYRRNGVGTLLLDKVNPTKFGDKVSIECEDEHYGSLKFLNAHGYVVTQAIEPEFDLDGEKVFNGSFVLNKEKRAPMELANRLARYPFKGE